MKITMKNLLKFVNDPQKRTDLPKLQVGDLVQVYVKIKEGNRERVQMFDGTIIAMKNGSGISATITVRKIASGVGVEKTFMLNSPSINKIKVVRHGKVRRAKLYYLRDRVGKAAKVVERIVSKSNEEEVLEPVAPDKIVEAPVEIVEETAADVVANEEVAPEEVAVSEVVDEKPAEVVDSNEEDVATETPEVAAPSEAPIEEPPTPETPAEETPETPAE